MRVLTFSDPSAAPAVTQLREAWRPDKRTVVVQVRGVGVEWELRRGTAALWLMDVLLQM